jgi:hypothetical protein
MREISFFFGAKKGDTAAIEKNPVPIAHLPSRLNTARARQETASAAPPIKRNNRWSLLKTESTFCMTLKRGYSGKKILSTSGFTSKNRLLFIPNDLRQCKAALHCRTI